MAICLHGKMYSLNCNCYYFVLAIKLIHEFRELRELVPRSCKFCFRKLGSILNCSFLAGTDHTLTHSDFSFFYYFINISSQLLILGRNSIRYSLSSKSPRCSLFISTGYEPKQALICFRLLLRRRSIVTVQTEIAFQQRLIHRGNEGKVYNPS